jgi:(2Fe-2S) ferredoxin
MGPVHTVYSSGKDYGACTYTGVERIVGLVNGGGKGHELLYNVEK